MQVEYQAQTAEGLCMVHNIIGRYENTLSLLSGKVRLVTAVDRV